MVRKSRDFPTGFESGLSQNPHKIYRLEIGGSLIGDLRKVRRLKEETKGGRQMIDSGG